MHKSQSLRKRIVKISKEPEVLKHLKIEEAWTCKQKVPKLPEFKLDQIGEESVSKLSKPTEREGEKKRNQSDPDLRGKEW